MPHWTERVFRDDPAVFRHHLEARRDDADEDIADLLSLLADHGIDPETVLDVACGIGRHSVELAARDRRVRGLDISESYLERARELARERDVTARTTFERADMRDLAERTDRYDCVLNAWTSFGYFDEATNRDVLAGLYERTAADGAVVLELVNREGILADFAAASVPETDDRFVVETREYHPETARMETERQVFTTAGDGYEHVGEMAYDVRLYSPVELHERCRAVGFSDVSVYAALDGAPLARDSPRCTVVAER